MGISLAPTNTENAASTSKTSMLSWHKGADKTERLMIKEIKDAGGEPDHQAAGIHGVRQRTAP
ncbi:MAG: hypothetical protein EBU75_07045 [Betaproteobacteria bacterium]|nr:hypothetical protein [Betaproteobacteria bacterium]